MTTGDPKEFASVLSINIIAQAADMTASNADRTAKRNRNTAEQARAAFSANISKCFSTTALNYATLLSNEPTESVEESRTFCRKLLDETRADLDRRELQIADFWKSDKWKKVKSALPDDVTNEDAPSIFIAGLSAFIIRDIPGLKRKIKQYEQEHSEKLTFVKMTEAEIPDEGQDEDPLIYKFLRELREEGHDAETGERKTRAGRPLRTQAKAGAVDPIGIKRLALITASDYVNALNFNKQGEAYLNNIGDMTGLEFEDGEMYIAGKSKAVSEVELRNMHTKEGITNINLPLLQFYYSIMFKKYESLIYDKYVLGKPGKMNASVSLYLPDLAEARGLSRQAGSASIAAIQEELSAFDSIVGILKHKDYREPSMYRVLVVTKYEAPTNTITVTSEYLFHVVEEIYKASVLYKNVKEGKETKRVTRFKKDNRPMTKAVNSYLIHTDIMKERNKAAVQNVFRIVQGIERCGGSPGKDEDGKDIVYEYSISLLNLIDSNPILKDQIENGGNVTQTLKRCFTATWKLLETKTDLRTAYKDITLPSPDNPADIPTAKSVNSMVLYFRHKGKKPAKNNASLHKTAK